MFDAEASIVEFEGYAKKDQKAANGIEFILYCYKKYGAMDFSKLAEDGMINVSRDEKD